MVETAGEGEVDSFGDAFVPNTPPIDAPSTAKTTTPAMMRNNHNGKQRICLCLLSLDLCGSVP